MIYYKIKCKYTVTEEADEAKLTRFWRKADSSYIGGKIYKLFILERDDTAFDALLMFSVSDHSLASIKKRVITNREHQNSVNCCFITVKNNHPKYLSANITIFLKPLRK